MIRTWKEKNMFMFFKRFAKKRETLSNEVKGNENIFNNPSFLFSQCGLNDLWQGLVKGQGTAVDEYMDYVEFLNSLNANYRTINFSDVIINILSDDKKNALKITRGELMYLSVFNFKKDLILTDDFSGIVYKLNYNDYYNLTNELSDDEREYTKAMVGYFSKYITPKVNSVSNIRWGIDTFKTVLPLNCLEYKEYHRYIAEEEYDYDGGKNTKWNYVYSAPVCSSTKMSEENPIIPMSINCLTAFILDCLCYINIALPTLDIVKVMNYRNENTSVREALTSRFGPGVDKFMMRCVSDYSCANFRKWVTIGLKTQ